VNTEKIQHIVDRLKIAISIVEQSNLLTAGNIVPYIDYQLRAQMLVDINAFNSVGKLTEHKRESFVEFRYGYNSVKGKYVELITECILNQLGYVYQMTADRSVARQQAGIDLFIQEQSYKSTSVSIKTMRTNNGSFLSYPSFCQGDADQIIMVDPTVGVLIQGDRDDMCQIMTQSMYTKIIDFAESSHIIHNIRFEPYLFTLTE
jgi:hypothetical protein